MLPTLLYVPNLTSTALALSIVADANFCRTFGAEF